MKHTTHAKHPVAHKKVNGAVIKRAYKRSLKTMKEHPVSSIGIIGIGAAGLLSGLYIISKYIKH